MPATEFDDEVAQVAPPAAHRTVYTTGCLVRHGPVKPRVVLVTITVRTLDGWGQCVMRDTDDMEVADSVQHDPLEQLRLGAVLFNLYCIKKGITNGVNPKI